MIYTKDQLKKLHEKLLIIIEKIDQVCKLHNIRYFIGYGTLLGAVRHKGFIPWDDDLDIVMLREDYEKFISFPKEEFDNKVFIQTCLNSKGYGHVFAKAILDGTLYVEKFAKNVNCNKGIYVDVFPIDSTTAEGHKLKKQNRKCLFYAKLMLLKCNYSFEKKGIKKIAYSLLRVYSKFFDKEKLYKKWFRTATKYSNPHASFCMSMASIYPLDKELLPIKLFNESKLYNFENLVLNSVKDFDIYLKYIYGDYTKLPSPDKRIAKHNALKIDFGD